MTMFTPGIKHAFSLKLKPLAEDKDLTGIYVIHAFCPALFWKSQFTLISQSQQLEHVY